MEKNKRLMLILQLPCCGYSAITWIWFFPLGMPCICFALWYTLTKLRYKGATREE